MTEPRTICYLGNFSRPWCTEVHVAASLEQLGHRVVRLQESETDWTGIPARVDAEGAHMLLWTRTWPAELDVVVPELERLRDAGVPTVSYHLDRWFGLDREHQVVDQPFFHTALVVSPDDSPRWAAHGVNHRWMPPGVFGDECGIVEAKPRQWPFDVVFVGSFPYPHAEWAEYRGELVGRFAAEFGRRFTVLPRKGQPIRGRRLQELYATVPVIVGDSCLAGESHRYWSDRIPETLGRGGLLIHPEIPGDVGVGGEWYDEDAILTYTLGDFDAALEWARWALTVPASAQKWRDVGRATVLGRDTYVHRMAELLEHVESEFGWREAPAPPPAPPAPPEAVTVRCGPRWRATFELRPDVPSDREVVDECWKSNDYRVPVGGFAGGTVVDVGANIGAFSVLAAKAGAGKVVAVEPFASNRERLMHHVSMNGTVDQTFIDHRAITGSTGNGVVMTGAGGGAHIDQDGIGSDEHVVATLALEDLIALHAPVRFLKIDIEGGEYDALRTVEAHTLNEHVVELALEFHGPGMPHLAHLNEDGRHLERWGAMVALLADCGRLEILGHPMVGGLIWWKRY